MPELPKGKAGRQQLIHKTPAELAALIGEDSPIAVSRSSLKKYLGVLGVARLIREEKARRDSTR